MRSPADDGAFLEALVRRMGARVAVFVPTSRHPRSLWLDGSGVPEEIDALAELGRQWLVEHPHGANAPVVDGVERSDDGTVVFAPAWSGRSVCGAIVTLKEPGSVWTDGEVTVLRFAVDYYAPLLERWATRPRPALAPQPASTGPRSGAEFDTAIRRATVNGELFLRYQPEIDLRDGSVTAVEALVRWHHPVRGELGPESFIAVAERSDLIKLLGRWVIDESLREFSRLLDLRPGMSLRVNVSPLQIGTELVGQFADALVRYGVPGDQVCVEITENLLSDDTPLVASTLQALKRLGVHSAIDDLASGYSSLTRLRSLPVDVIKIDRGLVSGIDDDVRAQAIVSALITLADVLGIRVVAEGVETPDEAAALLELGCLRAQGHHFGRPMTAAQLTGFLQPG